MRPSFSAMAEAIALWNGMCDACKDKVEKIARACPGGAHEPVPSEERAA